MSSADDGTGATLLPPAPDGTVALPGGGTLGYGRYGAADGPLVVVLDGVARRTRKDPAAAARKYAEGVPAADRAVLEDPRMWAIHETTSAEAVSSPAAFAREARLLAGRWDVDRGRVTAPAALWVGELDPTHPPVMARRLAQRLGGATVTVVPGAATFGMLPVYPDLLRHAAGLG
jgi:pimeloyl-ACP methyl ester carboxylesterase